MLCVVCCVLCDVCCMLFTTQFSVITDGGLGFPINVSRVLIALFYDRTNILIQNSIDEIILSPIPNEKSI